MNTLIGLLSPSLDAALGVSRLHPPQLHTLLSKDSLLPSVRLHLLHLGLEPHLVPSEAQAVTLTGKQSDSWAVAQYVFQLLPSQGSSPSPRNPLLFLFPLVAQVSTRPLSSLPA